MSTKYRWLIVLACALVTATAGLLLGKFKEQDYVGRLYARTDFTLLTDKGEFFQLSKFPASRLLLLVFTPDAISPEWVKQFQAFSRDVAELTELGVDIKMVTRTNREVARNFKQASRFNYDLLVDTSGTVGRNLGIWPDFHPAGFWGYALIDNKMQLYWKATEKLPMKYRELLDALKKVSASRTTSNALP